jgi:class 3 adenylate cyclase
MEKYGAPGRIHLSAATRDLLGDQFCFEARGGLEIKGKGVMETFFLEPHQEPDKCHRTTAMDPTSAVR